jgi:hypothetical protein
MGEPCHMIADARKSVVVDAGNGRQRREIAGEWWSNWFGLSLVAVICIMVDDFHEAIYLIGETDADGQPLNGKNRYTMTFPNGGFALCLRTYVPTEA